MGDRFEIIETGQKEFFTKDYKLKGEVFAYIKRTIFGYELIKVVPIP